VIEEEITSRRIDPRLIARLLAYLRPYASWVAVTFAIIIVGALVRQSAPYLSKIAIDDYVVPGDGDGLGGIALLFMGLLVAQFFLSYAQNWITQMIGQWAMRDVRVQLFSHLQRLSVGFFDRTPIGRLMVRNTNDVDALNDFFTESVVAMLSDLFTIVAILSFVFYMDVELGLVISLALPFLAATTVWLQLRTIQSHRRARTCFARFATALQEALAGMEVVQLFSCEKRSARHFEEDNDQYLDARLSATFYQAMYFPFMELAGTLLLALVLWHGTGQVLRQQIEWGVLVAALQYVPRFFMPIRDIAERYSSLQTATASSERIFELLDTDTEPTGSRALPESVSGDIEFRNVWFAYEDEDWVLRDVSFHVQRGHSLALVGATGAGKSTIINLLNRFYEIQRGTILLDGVDIRELDVRQLRRSIGVVQQDIFLFAGSVESNIGLDDPAVSPERIRQAAADVNADRFIQQLPGEYDYEVGERGVSLSLGQRQLLSFARALATDPDILVLDEATASVDTATELWIQQAVEKLMRERTAIVIAHRLSTLRNADRILVLHHGEIREQGRHEELLRLRGIYYRLNRLQHGDDDGRRKSVTR
jgi:ATP-binding cassette subfamily B multidrug efflux pump